MSGDPRLRDRWSRLAPPPSPCEAEAVLLAQSLGIRRCNRKGITCECKGK